MEEGRKTGRMEKAEVRTEEYDEFLEYILWIGKKLIENGAEVRRAEDTIMRICKAYEVKTCEVFATTTQILVTLRMEEGKSNTQFVRILSTKNDLGLLEELNQTAREICRIKPSVPDLKSYTEGRTAQKPEKWREMAGYIFAAGGFTWFFGGDRNDVFASSLIAVAIFGMDRCLKLREYNNLLYIVVSCMISGLAAMLFVHIGIGHETGIISVGVIMLFIPALAVTNGFREMFYRDIMAGLFRFLEAILITMSIAAGFSIAAWLGGIF